MILLGEKIKELRKSRGWTQKTLASHIGVAKSVVSYYELGERYPSYDVLIKLDSSFNVSTDYLLGVENGMTLSVSGLSDAQINALSNLIALMNHESRS